MIKYNDKHKLSHNFWFLFSTWSCGTLLVVLITRCNNSTQQCLRPLISVSISIHEQTRSRRAISRWSRRIRRTRRDKSYTMCPAWCSKMLTARILPVAVVKDAVGDDVTNFRICQYSTCKIIWKTVEIEWYTVYECGQSLTRRGKRYSKNCK